jgi:hypothetical protein
VITVPPPADVSDIVLNVIHTLDSSASLALSATARGLRQTDLRFAQDAAVSVSRPLYVGAVEAVGGYFWAGATVIEDTSGCVHCVLSLRETLNWSRQSTNHGREGWLHGSQHKKQKLS